MSLSNLIKAKKRNKKRLGRGLGSGKGKTGGRGTKGQKARGKIPLSFSGDLSFYRKLPNRRGLGNAKVSKNPKIITLSDLEKLPAKSVVDLEQLIKARLINRKEAEKGVKILGDGQLKKALTVKLPVSKSAQQKIEKLGGKVIYV